MTMWKRERNHFNYYVTNERKQPHIYVEALGTPSASTEKVLKDHGFKFDHNKCMYAAAQTNDLRLFVAHDLDKLFNYDIQLFFNTEAKKEKKKANVKKIASITQKDNLNKLKRTCKKVLFLYFHFFDLLLDQLLFNRIRCEKVHKKFCFKLIFFLIHFFYIQNSFKYHYRNKVCKQVCIFFYFLILIVFAA